MEFEIKDVRSWLRRATHQDLFLLLGAEFSQDFDIWQVAAIDSQRVTLKHCDDGRVQSYPLDRLPAGTFTFADESVAKDFAHLIYSEGSELERRIADAKLFVARYGFALSSFGGDVRILELAGLLDRVEKSDGLPNDELWSDIQRFFKDASDLALVKKGAALVSKYVLAAEEQQCGRFDLRKRVTLAYLYRRSGDVDAALSASSVVSATQDQYDGSQSTMEVLLTTRAAALMDRAEQRRNDRTSDLQQARRHLQHAYALSEGQSEEVRNAFARLGAIEKRYGNF